MHSTASPKSESNQPLIWRMSLHGHGQRFREETGKLQDNEWFINEEAPGFLGIYSKNEKNNNYEITYLRLKYNTLSNGRLEGAWEEVSEDAYRRSLQKSASQFLKQSEDYLSWKQASKPKSPTSMLIQAIGQSAIINLFVTLKKKFPTPPKPAPFDLRATGCQTTVTFDQYNDYSLPLRSTPSIASTVSTASISSTTSTSSTASTSSTISTTTSASENKSLDSQDVKHKRFLRWLEMGMDAIEVAYAKVPKETRNFNHKVRAFIGPIAIRVGIHVGIAPLLQEFRRDILKSKHSTEGKIEKTVDLLIGRINASLRENNEIKREFDAIKIKRDQNPEAEITLIKIAGQHHTLRMACNMLQEIGAFCKKEIKGEEREALLSLEVRRLLLAKINTIPGIHAIPPTSPTNYPKLHAALHVDPKNVKTHKEESFENTMSQLKQMHHK